MSDRTVIHALALLVAIGWCGWANEMAARADLRRDLVEFQRGTSQCVRLGGEPSLTACRIGASIVPLGAVSLAAATLVENAGAK